MALNGRAVGAHVGAAPPRQEAGGFLGTSGKGGPWRGQGAAWASPVTLR